mgnify:FL=1
MNFPPRLATLTPLALALGVLTPSVARAQAPTGDDHTHAGDEAPHPPIVTKHVEARYPESEERGGRESEVVLTVVVDAEGHVAKSEVFRSGGPAFDEAAQLAIRNWLFTPATRGGKPVPSRIRVPFHFAPEVTPVVDVLPKVPKKEDPQETTHAAVEAKKETPAEQTPAVENVSVYARKNPTSRGAADFRIAVDELGRIPRANASSVLTLAPGILLSNEGGDGHAEQVFLRGFDARQGQDIEFSVNGIPINESGNLEANGYADTHFVIPELIEGLRVVEGPYDVRQGNYAVAGSADFQLGLAKRGFTSKTTLGSFGTKRQLLLWGPKDQSVHTFGGAELYQTDGFGQNRAAKRASAMAQYEGQLGDKGNYRVFAQAYANDFQSAGLLRDDDFRSGRKGFYDSYDSQQGGQSSRFSLGFDLESTTGKTTYGLAAFAIARNVTIRDNFTGFLLDVQQPTQAPHSQRGDLIDRATSAMTLGFKGYSRTKFDFAKQEHEAEFGAYGRFDAVDALQFRDNFGTNVPYQRDIDLASKLADVGLWGDVSWKLHGKVQWKTGVRSDLFAFATQNNCAQKSVRRPSDGNPPGDASCLDQKDFGVYRDPSQRANTASTAVMPRSTLLVGPFRGFSFSVAAGSGVRSIDPSYVTDDRATPFARIASYDGGVIFTRTLGAFAVAARSSFFYTHVDKDLVFSQTEGRNTLANGTSRTGWLGSARITSKHLDSSSNVTFVRARFDDTGLLVPYVPDIVVRNDTVYHADLPVRLLGDALEGSIGAGMTFVGRRALPYGQRSDTIFTTDATASIGWKSLELQLSATNLFNTQYRLGEYNFASDWSPTSGGAARPTLTPVRHFSAGPPRSLFASFQIRFGGDS